MRWLFLFAIGCSNDLLPAGRCDSPPGDGGQPEVISIPLFGQPAHFDDLRFSPQLGKVLAVPEDTGRLFVVDPDSLEVLSTSVPGGSGTVDANAHTIFVGDRGSDRIVALDATTLEVVTTFQLTDNLDYVRVSPAGDELWVTTPGADRIDVLAIASDPVRLVAAGSIAVPGAAEGLTLGNGRAYTQALGRIIAVDTARKLTIGSWDTGCGWAHGYPQIDEDRGLVVGGCADHGGIAVLTADGVQRSGYEVGTGNAILAFDGARHHLYVRGDPGGHLDMFALCPDGGLGLLASVPIDDQGHGASADDRGHVWVADANTGGVLRISDPFPATP